MPYRAGVETLAVLPARYLWTLLLLHPVYCILSVRFAPLPKTAGHIPVLYLASFIVLTGKYLIILMLMLLYIYCSHGLCFLLLNSIRLYEMWIMRYTFTEKLVQITNLQKSGSNDTCFHFLTVCAGSLQLYWHSLGPKVH